MKAAQEQSFLQIKSVNNDSTFLPSFITSNNEEIDEGDISRNPISTQIAKYDSEYFKIERGNSRNPGTQQLRMSLTPITMKQGQQISQKNQRLMTDHDGLQRPNPSSYKQMYLSENIKIELEGNNKFQVPSSTQNQNKNTFFNEKYQPPSNPHEQYNLLRMHKAKSNYDNDKYLQQFQSIAHCTQGVQKQKQMEQLNTLNNKYEMKELNDQRHLNYYSQNGDQETKNSEGTVNNDQEQFIEPFELFSNCYVKTQNNNNNITNQQVKNTQFKSNLRQSKKLSAAQSYSNLHSNMKLNSHLSSTTQLKQPGGTNYMSNRPTSTTTHILMPNKPKQLLSPPIKSKKQQQCLDNNSKVLFQSKTAQKSQNHKKEKDQDYKQLTLGLRACKEKKNNPQTQHRFSELVEIKSQDVITPTTKCRHDTFQTDSEKSCGASPTANIPLEFSAKSTRDVEKQKQYTIEVNPPLEEFIKVQDSDEQQEICYISLQQLDEERVSLPKALTFEGSDSYIDNGSSIIEQPTKNNYNKSTFSTLANKKTQLKVETKHSRNHPTKLSQTQFTPKGGKSRQAKASRKDLTNLNIGNFGSPNQRTQPMSATFNVDSFKQLFESNRKNNLKKTQEFDTLKTPRSKKASQHGTSPRKKIEIISNMVDVEKEKTKGEEIHEEIQRIRMTLRSKETKPLESACAEIVARAKNQGYETKGPVRIPTKILRITTRKSPCGEGSKTWDRFEMRIHKRVIDIHCPSSVVKEITNFRIDPGVDVNLIMKNTPFTNPPLGMQSRPPMGNKGSQGQHNQQDLNKLLPQTKDTERQAVLEQLLEILSKEIDQNQVQKIIMEQSSGINAHQDHGELSSINNPIQAIVSLESLILSKYPDTNGSNYKGLSKRIIQSLKSKVDQRQQLLESKEIAQIEDFLQGFLFNKPGKTTQGQESAGSGAGNQSNPFAFQNRPGAGGPPMANKKPAGPQGKLPQQRFAVGNFFQAPTMPTTQYAAPAINITEKDQNSNIIENNQKDNSNVFGDDPQSHQEQERPVIQHHNNQQMEEQKQSKDIPTINFSDSGAADISSLNPKPQQQMKNNWQPNINNNKQEAKIFSDEFDFFQSLADTAVKQQQQPQPSDYHQRNQFNGLQQNKQEIAQNNQQPRVIQAFEEQTNQNQEPIQQYSQQEEQSRGDLSMEGQRLEFEDEPEQQQKNQEEEKTTRTFQMQFTNNQMEGSNQTNENDETGKIQAYKEEGTIFDSRVNLEQEEGLQTDHQNFLDSSLRNQFEDNNFDIIKNNNNIIEGEQAQQHLLMPEQFKHERYNTEISPYEQLQFDNRRPESRGSTTRIPTQSHFTENEESKYMNRIGSQTMLNQNNLPLQSPSMKGFIQSFQSSRPPQSVASVNITNLEDSEGLIRAYKKKKAELDELKEKFYTIETDYFTERQKNLMLEEDIARLRQSLNRAEKLYKEAQLKEQRQDSNVLIKQLQLKNQEATAYQSELNNQKQENAKLREKIKELMNRSRMVGSPLPQSSVDNHQTQEQLIKVIREKDDLSTKLENLRKEMNSKINQSNEQLLKIENEKNDVIQRLEKQVHEIKQLNSQNSHQQDAWINKMQQEKMQLEEELKNKNQLIENLKKQVEQTKSQEKKNSATKKSEENSSFVNLQQENQSPSEGYYAGYYDSNNISIHSAKSSSGDTNKAKQQQNEYPLMTSSYFGNDESEKQSSAPPSQIKQVTQQPKQQVQQPFHQQPPPQKNQLAGQKSANTTQILQEAEDFFSNFPQKQQQMRQNPQQQQQQLQQQKPTMVQQQQQNKPQVQQQQQIPAKQNVLQHPPQQQQQQQMAQNKPPRPQQQQNLYNFSLDDISFEQSFNQPQPQNQQQKQQPQIRQQQPQQQINPQQKQMVQNPQVKNNYADFDFGASNNASSIKNEANVIPKSLFD